MNNQFCKKCGHANFPNSNNCTKCGNALDHVANNPFGSSEEPPPTVMAGQQFSIPTSPKTEKKSNKTFWIVGIVAVLLVLFVGILGIAGIGGYLYYSSQEDFVVREDSNKDSKNDDNKGQDDSKNDDSKSDDDSALSDIKFPAGTGSDKDMSGGKSTGTENVTDAQLLDFFLKQKPTVGKYTLKTVKTSDNKDNFPNRTAGATAEYKKGSKIVIHEVALYGSTSSLKEDFEAYKQKAKSGGGKIETSKETSIIYIKGSSVYLAFYNPQGGFHVMSSRNGNDILEYHNAYFDIKE